MKQLKLAYYKNLKYLVFQVSCIPFVKTPPCKQRKNKQTTNGSSFMYFCFISLRRTFFIRLFEFMVQQFNNNNENLLLLMIIMLSNNTIRCPLFAFCIQVHFVCYMVIFVPIRISYKTMIIYPPVNKMQTVSSLFL